MADRVTKVRVDGDWSSYISGAQKSASATREVTSEADKLASKGEAFQTVGRAALAVGALAAVGVGLAVAKFAEFDQQMSNVQAATHESAAAMSELREAALDAGARTVFSATEAATAIEELAKAGLSTADILNGALDGALSLAAASGIAVGEAAEIASKTLNQFNLEGAKTEHVADLLAAGAGKASGEVGDLGQALAQVGQVAYGAGLSVEETTTALAAFASQGLLGSDAGTSFKTMLGALTPNSAKAAEEMKRLGISAYDASGQFVGLEAFAGNLKTSLSGLTDEQRSASLEIIFGSDAVRAASALYNEGADGIAQWSEKVDDSGYAAETAALRMDNLAGDVEKLGGAFDTALIKTGSAANDVLRGLVQGVTGLIDTFSEAPQGVQTTTLALGALTAGVGLVGGAALLAVPKVAAFKVALETLGISAGKTNAVMGTLKATMVALPLIALGAWAASAASEFIDAQREALGLKDTVDSLKKSLDELGVKGTVDKVDVGGLTGIGALTNGGGFSDALRSGEQFNGMLADAIPAIKLFGIESNLTTEKVATLDATMADLVSDGNTERAAALYEELASRTDGSKEALARLDELLPEYSAAQGEASSATETTTAEVEEFTSTTETAEAAVDTFVEALRGLGDTQLSLNDANRAVEESLDSFTAKIAENGQTLDITTEAGRENSAALDAIAAAYKEKAAATVEDTGVQADAIPVIQAGRDEIIRAGEAAGLSAEQASAYADELGLIPADVQTVINLQHQEAMDRARAMARMIEEIPNSKTVYLYIQEQRAIANIPAGQTIAGANGMIHSYAGGGFGTGFYAGGTPIYKFAEPETRWEAFISGKPGEEERNRAIALEAYQRLGGQMSQTAPSLSLDGLSITGLFEIGGDGLGRIIDGRIVQAGRAQRVGLENGSRR